MLQWDKRFELGNEKIDAEHQVFLNLISEFQKVVEQKSSKETQAAILKKIIEFSLMHSLSEEKLMAELNYPDINKHVGHHQQYRSAVENKLYEINHDLINPNEVVDLLFQWFALHTTTEDKELVKFMNSKTNK